jgi:hypothetical protein
MLFFRPSPEFGAGRKSVHRCTRIPVSKPSWQDGSGRMSTEAIPRQRPAGERRLMWGAPISPWDRFSLRWPAHFICVPLLLQSRIRLPGENGNRAFNVICPHHHVDPIRGFALECMTHLQLTVVPHSGTDRSARAFLRMHGFLAVASSLPRNTAIW